MATLAEIFALRGCSALRNRTAAACWKAAGDILNEAPETANHANRVTWAKAAMADNGEGAVVMQMFRSVCSNATIQGVGDAATDNDIQYVVNAVVNLFATGA